MAKKFKIKEAELLDDQMKEQNAPESTVIPATPEEVSQATDTAVEEPSMPSATPATGNVGASIETPEGSAGVSEGEVESPMGNGVEVQPETVSIDVQVPVQQLGQAVAMATGDVRTAELSPDLEAEKVSQAEEANKQPMVADNMEAPSTEPTLGGGIDTTSVETPTSIEEPQPVHESLDHEAEDGEPDPEMMGASYRDLMKLNKQRETEARRRGRIINESSEEVDPNEMGASFRALQKMQAENGKEDLLESSKITEDLKDDLEAESPINKSVKKPKMPSNNPVEKPEAFENKDIAEDSEANELEDKIEEPKEALNFKSLKSNADTSFNPNLPKGLAETDENFDDTLDFGNLDNQDNQDFSDIGSLFNSALEDKDSDEISAAAETLHVASDALNKAATALEDRAEEDDTEEDSEALDFEDVRSDEDSDDVLPGEKLDFKALLSDSDDDYEDDYEDNTEDDFEEEDKDLEESRKRVPCKLPVKSNLQERRSPMVSRPTANHRITESKRPLVRPRNSVLTESAQKRLHTPMRDRINESVDINGIIFPKGSEDVKNLFLNDSENLVSAHERVLEARKKALMDFHRTMNESKDNTRETASSRYRESIREVRPNRPSNSRFNEALRSSVRTSRLTEDNSNSNSNSWANNRTIDRYEESQKFNFRELLKNGYLG